MSNTLGEDDVHENLFNPLSPEHVASSSLLRPAGSAGTWDSHAAGVALVFGGGADVAASAGTV